MLAREIENLIQKANARHKEDGSSLFSNKASKLLVDTSSRYIVELISLSIKFAKHDNADVVSATHVKQAGDCLGHKVLSGCQKYFRIIGGFLLILGLTSVINMICGGARSNAGIIVTSILCILGSSGVILSFMKYQ